MNKEEFKKLFYASFRAYESLIKDYRQLNELSENDIKENAQNVLFEKIWTDIEENIGENYE